MRLGGLHTPEGSQQKLNCSLRHVGVRGSCNGGSNANLILMILLAPEIKVLANRTIRPLGPPISDV